MRIDIAASGIRQTTRTETLTQYFNDIPKNVKLTSQETAELYNRYITETDPRKKIRLRDKIISANLLFVISIAKRYSTEETLMDIIQDGNIGLLKALEHYDPSKDAAFITYAVHFIVREINDYKTCKEKIIRANNSCKTFHIQARAREILFKELNREPSLDEIKEYINANYKRYAIKDSSDLRGIKMTYVDESPVNSDEMSINAGEIADFNSYSASQNNYLKTENLEHCSMITTDLLHGLKPLEQEVIKYAFGIGHFREYTTIEIAEKLDYTPERIRQVKDSAMSKLRMAFIKKYKEQ